MASNYFIAFVFVNFLAVIGLLFTMSIETGDPQDQPDWVERSSTARREAKARWLQSVAAMRKTTKPTPSVAKAQHNKTTPKSTAIVFDEPMLNYMYGVKKQPPSTAPRVFEQRGILLDDHEVQVDTKQVLFPAHEFQPFTVIGGDEAEVNQKSKASFEGEVHAPFTGEIWHVRERHLRVPLPDCGYRSTLDEFVTSTGNPRALHVKKGAIALAPQVWSWQHFVQDAFPKIVTMINMGLLDHSRPLLLPPPHDPIISEILESLNLTWMPEPRSPPSFYAEDLVIACHLPGSHPNIWKGVRRALTATTPVVPHDYLVYLSRKNARNGRKESNYEDLRNMLTKTFSGESREFTGGKLMDVIHMFAGASVVVGSHGGGLYNALFSKRNACIIEQQPRSVYMHSSNREIFHRIATQSGQTYIRVLRDDEGYDFHIAYLERAVKLCLGAHRGDSVQVVPKAVQDLSPKDVKSAEEKSGAAEMQDTGRDYLLPTDKIDFVIPWVNWSTGFFESKTKPFDFGTPLYNIVSEVGLKRAPWTEICWTVRSILHNGGNSIGTIFIVYNAHRHSAPACNFNTKQVVSVPQQNFLRNTVLDDPNMSSPRPDSVLQFVHKINNLRDFFIFSMDDIFLLREFQTTDFYDFDHKKILTHMTAGRSGISPGTSYGASELEKFFKKPVVHGNGLHVPFMVRRKSQERLTNALSHLFSRCAPPVHLCDFGTHYQSLVQNFMILEGFAENRAPAQFAEIHTTSSTQLYKALTQSRATWLDVQGTGVSDEYGGDEANRIRIRKEFDRWLQEQAFYRAPETRKLFGAWNEKGKPKYDIDKTAIGRMVAHAANYTREMQLSSSLQDFWKWVYRTDQDKQVVYVKIEDLDHLKIPSAQLLGPFMFLSRKRGYRFAGCSRNGTVAAFSRDSVLKSWFGKSEFDERNCLHTVGGLENARLLGFDFHNIIGMKSDQDSLRKIQIQTRPKAATDVYMWDELCDSLEICKSRCKMRRPCIAYEWKENTECHMYREQNYTYPKTKSIQSMERIDCTKCSCHPTDTITQEMTREQTCALLKGKTIQFAGDSLVRDQWTMFGVWLASKEIDIFDAMEVETHAQCMINAWKFLRYLGIEHRLKRMGIWSDAIHSEFTVCRGTVKLRFADVKTFEKIQDKFQQVGSFDNIDVFVVGAGIHQMVTFGNEETQVKEFISWLDTLSERLKGKTEVIYVGTHRRIIELAPLPYKAYAKGPQGNQKIQRWNDLFCNLLKKSKCINPYFVTASLPATYADTEDGMHMGAWVNYQKVQIILKKINHTKQDTQRFLTLCMPTTPRDGNVTYLTQVLAAYRTQIHDPAISNMKIVVVNTRPGGHSEFERVKRRYSGIPEFGFAELSAEQTHWADPLEFDVDNMKNPKNIPGLSVRRQTHDLVNVTDKCILPDMRGVFTMLVEDDFVPCKAAIQKIHASVREMQNEAGWKTLSFSIGMNGIVMRTETTLMQMRRFMYENYHILPPDLLVYGHDPGYQGKDVRKGRNFFEHIGAVSSFGFRNTDEFVSAHARGRAVQCAI